VSPIDTAELEYRLSGGAANTDPAASLGGAMSTAGGGVITSAQLHNLFDPVTGDQAAAGHVDYRGIYVRNTDGALTWRAVKAWISSLTSSADTEYAIAIADEAAGVAMETIADELTAPSGPAFSSPTTKGTGLTVGDVGSGSFRGLWVRRTVTAGAAPANDSGTIRCEGDTDP
jgi:hypothetical protein